MRRRAGLVLLAFAVFFAALSPLLRWCAFPRLAKAPPSQYQEVVQGIEFKWPFLTEKRDYEYDLGLGTGLAAPALGLEARSRRPRSATNA